MACQECEKLKDECSSTLTSIEEQRAANRFLLSRNTMRANKRIIWGLEARYKEAFKHLQCHMKEWHPVGGEVVR